MLTLKNDIFSGDDPNKASVKHVSGICIETTHRKVDYFACFWVGICCRSLNVLFARYFDNDLIKEDDEVETNFRMIEFHTIVGSFVAQPTW